MHMAQTVNKEHRGLKMGLGGLVVLLMLALPLQAYGDAWFTLGRDLDNVALIKLSTQFPTRRGEFLAMSESVLEGNIKVSGTFIEGTYAYIYDKPMRERGITFDEKILVVLFECDRRYSGQITVVQKLKGKVVNQDATQDDDVWMMPQTGRDIVSALCELRAGKKPGPLVTSNGK